MAEKQDVLEVDFPGKRITPIFSNAFHVVVAPHSTRLVLGEVVFTDVPTVYSSAVVLPTEVAIDLAQSILRIAAAEGFLKATDQEAVDVG